MNSDLFESIVKVSAVYVCNLIAFAPDATAASISLIALFISPLWFPDNSAIIYGSVLNPIFLSLITNSFFIVLNIYIISFFKNIFGHSINFKIIIF